MSVTSATICSDDIYVGENTSKILTPMLLSMESAIMGLDDNKAESNHTHTDVMEMIEMLDNDKAPTTHTHDMAKIDGLNAKLGQIDAAIEELKAVGGDEGTVQPLLIASMHRGRLDNISGAEVASSTRICSDPFVVTSGKSYYQVNDKGVNMYALLYDIDEMFLEYLGNFASGQEIKVENENVAYMRLSSLVGEYDLTNEFRIYDVNPETGGVPEPDAGYTKEEADSLFAAKNHTHDGYAPQVHTHNGYALEGHTHTGFAPESHTHTGYAAEKHTHKAEDITGLPSSVDAYSKTEADKTFAVKNHTHAEYFSEQEAVDAFAAKGHTHTAVDVGAAPATHTHTAAEVGAAPTNHYHSEYAPDGHTHSGYAPSNHSHSGYAPSGHTHTAREIGAFPADGGRIEGTLTVTGVATLQGKAYTQQIQPMDGGSYSIGTGDRRYYSTYLRVNPNVSSDKRLKRDIAAMDAAALAAFVDSLPVVSYNYNDDAEGEEKRIGLIAQDVISANPEIARSFVEQDKKGFYSLRPADFVFPLIAAVQVLSARVAELEGKK